MALSQKQRDFVDRYIGEAKWNATEAARQAGYAHPNVQGSRLLANVSIKAEIARVVSERVISRDELLIELAEQARFDLGQFLHIPQGYTDPPPPIGPDDEPTPPPFVGVDLQKIIDAGAGRFIKSISPTRYGDKIEFHDPFAAKRLIARHLLDTGTPDNPIHTVTESRAEWEQRAAQRAASAANTLAEFGEPDEPDGAE